MTNRARSTYSGFAGLAALAVLAVVTATSPIGLSDVRMIVLLAVMIAFTTVFSVRLGGGVVSLMPMIVAAAYLTLGQVSALWVVVLGLMGQAGLRLLRGKRPELREPRGRALVERTAMNVGMHCFGLIAGAAAVEGLGVEIPLLFLNASVVLRLLLGGLTYLGVNYVLAAVYLLSRGRSALNTYVGTLPRLTLYEGVPIAMSPLVAIVYARLGFYYVVQLGLWVATGALISHYLSETSERLQRRVTELASLQAVGQALSFSLDVDTVLAAVYEQVSRLLPASSFYVALYEPSTDEVAFPVVIEEGRRHLNSRSRRARNGLTEHIIRTAEPLLIADHVGETVAELGLESIGRLARCWLGVPIKSSAEVLGVLAVQSYDDSALYDESHLVIFQTIAAQASVALQNARLYERTDESLARRVRELDSVLRTTDDGVLLMDLDYRVLAVNRALAAMVGISQWDLSRQPIDAQLSDGESLISQIHYTLDRLASDASRLRSGAVDQIQDVVAFQPSGPHAERTLAAVRDNTGVVMGWLLVFRDLTEELELQHLRDDMIDMLVHDLRSPISLVMASLSMLADAFEQGDVEQIAQLTGIAQRSSERMLALIDELLDISQLERGRLPLDPEPIAVAGLLREIAVRYLAAASANDVALRTELSDERLVIFADRSLIARVLANLVDNALKFTQEGGSVIMRAELAAETFPGMLVLSVEDAGPGIPAEHRGKLFEKFQQIPNIRGRRRGTGLGLPFCRLVVEAHAGRIWVESEVGKGSSFCFTLPLDSSEPDSTL